MTHHFNRLVYFFLCILLSFLVASCSKKSYPLYSKVNYEPIPKIELKHYKSPQLRPNQDSSLSLGISIAGGGSRAQYFGTGVLIGLDEIKNTKANANSFLNEIDYFSTVSGGGFAAGYYLAVRKIGVLNGVHANYYDLWKYKLGQGKNDELEEYLWLKAKGNLGMLIRFWRYERNLYRKSYVSIIDKELLQRTKEYPPNSDIHIKRIYLKDFFVSLDSTHLDVKHPMFITNGTIYNNGERLPFMPHIINSLKLTGSYLPRESKPFENLENGYGLPLSYAITGSAAFPGVLPMLKFKTDDPNRRVLRVIDGGTVDNLGFVTLFETLKLEPCDPSKKRALIVDCSGLGKDIQLQKNDKLSLLKLTEKALLYTLETKRVYSDTDISIHAKYYNLEEKDNIVKIGFLTIKNKLFAMERSAEVEELDKYKKCVKDLEDFNKKTKDKKKKGNKSAFARFVKNLNDSGEFGTVTTTNVALIPTEKFSKFSLSQVFYIFELSAQVKTKIKIYPAEKQMLILAGRYAVYLERMRIKNLLR